MNLDITAREAMTAAPSGQDGNQEIVEEFASGDSGSTKNSKKQENAFFGGAAAAVGTLVSNRSEDLEGIQTATYTEDEQG